MGLLAAAVFVDRLHMTALSLFERTRVRGGLLCETHTQERLAEDTPRRDWVPRLLRRRRF